MSGKKRQEMPVRKSTSGKASPSEGADGTPGTLYVVATPIGNLEDLSPRAARILREVDAVLSEDTRVGHRLLAASGIENGVERCDQHTDPGRIRWFVERLEKGESFALISDAGTPAISDPGAALVAAADLAGISVVPIPGPSALTAFLSAAGFERGSPVFRGFYPRKRAERDAEWARIERLPFDSLVVWFESPERIEEMIVDLAARFPEIRGAAGKEITKIHERFYRGYLKEIASHIQSKAGSSENRGEWVVGIEWIARETSNGDRSSGDWEKVLRSMLNAGISASRAAREVSQVFGIPKKPVYSRALEWSVENRTAANDAENGGKEDLD
jgi:16S rRNA (cytidine1402-2'-O)-methyltransferase